MDDGLYKLEMYSDGRLPAAMALADMDVMDIVNVVVLYVHSTDRVPNIHEISASCTVMADGSIADNELYAGIGLLFVAAIV